MHYLDKSIKEIHTALITNKTTSLELTKESLKRAEMFQNCINSFVTITKELAIETSKNIKLNTFLSGIPYALKDNISTKGILSTGSSNILNNYIPVYDATCVTKLNESNAVLIGKTVLDELAMSGTGTTGHTGNVNNPWDVKRYMGGSSAGSASSVAIGITPYALGSDTGGSIRKPAGYGGVVGFKPTYGLVSRYGLFAFSSSLDHAGCITKSVEDAAYVIDAIKGKDEKDMTSIDSSSVNLVNDLTTNVKGKKLFYIKEIIDKLKDNKEYYKIFNESLEYCKSLGIEVKEESINCKLLNAVRPSYLVISSAESTSSNSNLTGIAFGSRQDGNTIDDIIINTRTNGFGELAKRKFILGSYALQEENQEKFFLNTKRVRRLIVNKINDLFKEYDGYILPNSGSVAPLFTKELDRFSEENLLLENHLAIANFGGFPSISIPAGLIDNLPVSINITTGVLKDQQALNIALALESKIKFTPLSLKGGK